MLPPPPGPHHHDSFVFRTGLEPGILASVARTPLFEIRGVRFTHNSPYWLTSVTYVYAIWWVGLGLWGMRIICTWKLRIICTPTNFVSYARQNCILYARQQIRIICTRKLRIIYTPNTCISNRSTIHFCVSIPRVFGSYLHINTRWYSLLYFRTQYLSSVSCRCCLFMN